MPAATVLIVPGYNGSGPDHWQTRWQAERRDCRRVEQARWNDPDPNGWCTALAAHAAAAEPPVIIVAHSLGCATVAHWVARGGNIAGIAGALLVAPCDVERPGLPDCITRFAPMPRVALPFRSTVVASSNDSYATLERARAFASDWGSAFVNAGQIGHINAASGLGNWPFGKVLLDTLIGTASADRSPYVRAAALRSAAAPPP
ncbi:RBBP9/YdeN family alpha/beta hydrolase [Sandarakinorhabdus sp. DWP1-3-1]|uniref:RBBP9/YdeN family alpha/beta hydrolase n=1 Tax=Sandarakinorhabdus sp. DWP1-3-1 TaxID=2804627 RepID=UPI003CF3206D